MIDVKDRVPVKPGRVKFIFDDGTVKYATMERADEAVENGTPINKALFNSIKSGNDLVQKFNVPSAENSSTENFLKLDNIITKYEVGMRVLLKLEQVYSQRFTQSILPKFSSQNEKGYTITGPSNNSYVVVDDDDSTYCEGKSNLENTITITSPIPIKPEKIRVRYKGAYNSITLITKITLTGVNVKGETVPLFEEETESASIIDKIIDITTTEFLTSISFKISKSSGGSTSTTVYFYEFDIVQGECGKINPALNSYLNINNLGNVLIDTPLALDKKYELVYDGTMFIAKEV